MWFNISISETTAIKLKLALTLELPKPVNNTGFIKSQERKFILAHGTKEGHIIIDTNVSSEASCFLTELFERKPQLSNQLKKVGGELFLLCCYQNKQKAASISGGKLIIPFPSWEGKNKVTLIENNSQWTLSFYNKKLLKERKFK